MKILLIGGGGREHALAWKIAQSPLCSQLICAPGNPGICEIADCVDIAADNIDALVEFAKNEAIEFVVVGPEVPLAYGLVDRLSNLGIPAFGPSESASRLESSKAFTKDFCRRHNIPTARYDVFTKLADAVAFLGGMNAPYVIKADGLAAGKGVVIAETKEEAIDELTEFFSGKFGDASQCVIIEEFLQGYEISFFAISDGKTILPLIEAQDHKRAYDGDKGPNTGGMGAYSPVPGFDKALQNTIMADILLPTVYHMNKEGCPFIGVLFAGLMVTRDGPKLIEYNVRFGDPECQVLMRRLKSDLVEVMQAAVKGTLLDFPALKWSDEPVVNVVMAAKGYPEEYKKGSQIKGIEAANLEDGIRIFHAGTSRGADGILRSNGGRVLNITAQGKSLDEAVRRAYDCLDTFIEWPDGFVRRDIAHNAL